MFDLLFLVFVFPLAGFMILAFARGRLAEIPAAVVGVGSIGLSALLVLVLGVEFLNNPPPDHAYTQLLWTWMSVDGFAPQFALRLDALSLTMLGVITGVGFFIHLFASWYMRGDPGYDRFFSYMNLFVASMIFLVLGDNLLFLYFGWEGVGLCSYLLIGFWYKDPANGAAARKAFIVTRVGDTFMAIGLFILFHELGTLDIQELMVKAPNQWAVGSDIATLAALLLLGGAVGKSAQLPLQTWLPDAMAGPTPVSALIHAATMVTAGVYLIARTHVLFELSPFALSMVGWVGAVTLLMAGFTALTQTDIKRVLAYSTMSQIGYMFLALGAGAWGAAIFHLMTHAFFKALLFLSAGAVILAMHHEQDMFRMGGLRDKIPFVFWVFVIGCLGLVAFPGTSGFFSKDEILWEAWANGHPGLFYAGLAGAFMTAIYTSRMVFVTFFGAPRSEHAEHPHAGHGFAHTVPLAVLAVFALLGGFIHLPLESVLPVTPHADTSGKHTIEGISIAVSLSGIALAALLFLKAPRAVAAIAGNPAGSLLRRYWFNAWGFDWLYDLIFKRPYLWFVRVNAKDGIDVAIGFIPSSLRALHGVLVQTQTGQIRWYAMGVAAGAVLVLGAVVVLMTDSIILVWLIAIPFIGGLLSWFGELAGGLYYPRWIALCTMVLSLAISLWLWSVGDYSLSGIGAPGVDPRWALEFQYPWIERFGISVHLGLDGLSLLLIVLTNLLGLMAVACSWKEIGRYVGFFHLNLLWNLGGVVAVFLALDLFLFFFFWEMMLVPMYFLIAIWGHNAPGGRGRIYAATKFFIFTQASGLLLLLAILGLAWVNHQATGAWSFDYEVLLKTEMSGQVEWLLMLGFFIAFMVKLPVVPFHSWLPDAHSQAPTAGSVDLAGILLKTAAYGLMRFGLPLFPEASASFAPVAMWLGVVGIIYGAFMTFAQNDVKRLVAYSSVSHMGFVLIGIYAGTEQALQGAMITMIAHGISAGALFILCGEIYERIHSRDLREMGGLWARFPYLPPIVMFFCLAALGLPGLGNFVGEFLVLIGTWNVNKPVTIFAASGLILAAVYSLIMIQRAFHGPAKTDEKLEDLNRRELATCIALMAILLWLGVYPQPVLDTSAAAMQALHSLYAAAGGGQ